MVYFPIRNRYLRWILTYFESLWWIITKHFKWMKHFTQIKSFICQNENLFLYLFLLLRQDKPHGTAYLVVTNTFLLGSRYEEEREESRLKCQICNTFHSPAAVVPFVWAQFSIHYCGRTFLWSSLSLGGFWWLIDWSGLKPHWLHEVTSDNDMLFFFSRKSVREWTSFVRDWNKRGFLHCESIVACMCSWIHLYV